MSDEHLQNEMGTALIVPFPLARRIGKIRDVAAKMIAKPSDRGAAYYHSQIDDALRAQLDRLGVPADRRDAELTKFWQAVQIEIVRRIYGGSSRPGGTAA